jgi:hypothetical protein
LVCLALGANASLVQAQEIVQTPTVFPTETQIVPTSAPLMQGPVDAVPCASGCLTESCAPFDFKKVPPVRVFPRAGNFPIAPSGCGYYSLIDHLNGEAREKAPRFGYPPFALMPPSFFDADFRYLDDPKNKDCDWSDCLHRIRHGDDWLFSTGGQIWWRHMSENNSRLTNSDNRYDLFRVRAYGDLWYQDQARVFVEFISAQTFDQELQPLAIDRNYADLLNAFVEFKLPLECDDPTYIRVGRQELLLGSQRLVSTLDWANTRRNFDGVRLYHTSEKWDFDAFWMQPIVPNATRFDSSDDNQDFAGFWATHRPEKGHFMDFYYLYLNNTNNVAQQKLDRFPVSLHTLGSRYTGDRNQWLWDVEGAIQFGQHLDDRDVLAGMATVGGGYHFKELPMNPIFWVYYDWASGDSSPNSGKLNTFHQQFPFGHYYLGWGDWVGRQNIQDLNAHLFLYPTNYLTLWLQYHHFWLADKQDALYNPAGNVSKFDPSGKFGNEVGQELDVTLNVHIDKHQDFMIGYSRLYSGSFLKGNGPADGADLFYAMYSFRW